jgi:Ca-activated chloride channel family protein
MKIELQLDYKTILRNSSRPVHLVAKLTAPAQPLTQRARPTAFTVVLDRSGSMSGAPIEHAKQACREVIKNLRPEDYFSLVVFDSSAQVVIPLEQPINRFGWYQTVDQIQAGDSTNLMAGWLLGRDELLKALKTADGIAPIRKILLLTDGHLNAGITEPDHVEALTRAGLEKDEIRTSCLGFGDHYNENILAAMSKVGQGQLHDTDSPEKFPFILADELDGLQKITVQNLRLRIQPKMFCNAWKQYGDYPQVQLPDQRTELALGDLVSGEDRYIVLLLEVLPLPLLPDGSLPASLEGEELAALEFAYTSITEEGTDLRLESRTSAHQVRIQGTQNPADVVQNTELIAVIANQQAAEAMRKAADELAGGGSAEVAVQHFSSAKRFLAECAAPELTSEAAALLDEQEQKIRSQEIDSRARKSMRYEARYYGQTSSVRLYTGSREKSGFTKKQSVDEQLNKKPANETPKSSAEEGADGEKSK